MHNWNPAIQQHSDYSNTANFSICFVWPINWFNPLTISLESDEDLCHEKTRVPELLYGDDCLNRDLTISI